MCTSEAAFPPTDFRGGYPRRCFHELAHLAGSFTGTKRERTAAREAFYQHLLEVASVGRAYGIYLIIGTQRPSGDLLPTDFRAQLSGRVCFKVGDPQSSRMVLNMVGAEKLQKPGDALCLLDGLWRVQGYLAGVEITQVLGSVE